MMKLSGANPATYAQFENRRHVGQRLSSNIDTRTKPLNQGEHMPRSGKDLLAPRFTEFDSFWNSTWVQLA
jgi:hypothetical protein